MNIKHLVSAVLAVTVITLGLPVAANAQSDTAAMNQNMMSLQGSIFENRANVSYVTGKVVLHDISREEVYDFVSDLHNDTKWYPGTLSSELIEGDGGPGSKYEEVIFFGQPHTITATVLALIPNRHVWFTSDGYLTNLTHYHLRDGQDGSVVFTLRSFVELPEGVTKADMEAYLNVTFQLLMANLGTTGEISIPARGQ